MFSYDAFAAVMLDSIPMTGHYFAAVMLDSIPMTGHYFAAVMLDSIPMTGHYFVWEWSVLTGKICDLIRSEQYRDVDS